MYIYIVPIFLVACLFLPGLFTSILSKFVRAPQKNEQLLDPNGKK